MKTTVLRTDSSNNDFQLLVKKLDADLAMRDGEDHSFYAQFNKTDNIRYAVVVLAEGEPVGCGAIKPFEDDAMEVKRMYVVTNFRNRGVASKILLELEMWARELGKARCVLETGKRQPEAIKLYTKSGYKIISNYGQYKGKDNSVCFEKTLS